MVHDMAHSRAGGVGVKFALPDAELDEEERFVCMHPQIHTYTDWLKNKYIILRPVSWLDLI